MAISKYGIHREKDVHDNMQSDKTMTGKHPRTGAPYVEMIDGRMKTTIDKGYVDIRGMTQHSI
jgi:hypothetical protein